MPPTQIIELVIVGILAAVVLYNLYSVLGRRIGRQPGETGPQAQRAQGPADRRAPDAAAPPDVELSGLAALKARDPSFEVEKFLQGARTAYEMIVRAFATGDRGALKGLLSPDVMAGFEHAMAEREAQGRTEDITFEHPPRTDIEETQVEADRARIRVRFLAEFTSKVSGPDGEASQERRTAEAWTFERDLGSRDPNWTLVRVDAAQA
jgi:predicted lipid-binding transport protein (Tim44 family)